MYLGNVSTKRGIAHRGCLESFSESFPSFHSSQCMREMESSWTPARKALMTNASLLFLKDGMESSISWELLVVYESCRILCMDGESSEATCEQLAHRKYLLKEGSRARAFFSFSWAGLRANEEVKSSCISFLGPRPGLWKTEHRKLIMKYSGTRRWHRVYSHFLIPGARAT